MAHGLPEDYVKNLPRGFKVSDGKPVEVEIIDPETGEKLKNEDGTLQKRTITHPEGVVYSTDNTPSTQLDELTFKCPRCDATFKARAKEAMCNGLNVKVATDVPVDHPHYGAVFVARPGDTQPLSAEARREVSHSATDMEVVK